MKLDYGHVMSRCFALGQSATDDAALERFRKRMRRNLRSPEIAIHLFLISTSQVNDSRSEFPKKKYK